MTVLTDKPEVDWTDAALLVLIDWMSLTIARVQYLYPEPKHESYSSMTHYNLWYKRKYS